MPPHPSRMHGRDAPDDPAALPPDDLDHPTPLRRAVASGDPVVVRADPHWLPRIREAAAVCGRLGDLIVVLSGPVPLNGLPRPPLRAFALDAGLLGIAVHPAAGKRAGIDRPGDLPVLEPGDLSAPAPIVVLQSRRHERLGELGAALARAHLRLAPGSTHCRYLRISGLPNGVSAREAAGMGESWVRHIVWPGRGRLPSRGRDAAWPEAVAAYRALPGPELRDGTARLERHGIRAFVHDLPDPRYGDAATNRVAVHAACADGWIESGTAEIGDRPGGETDRLARLALVEAAVRGDIGLLTSANPALATGALQVDDDALADARSALVSGAGAAALRGHVDVETYLAASCGPNGRALMRLVRAAPAGSPDRRDFVRTWPAAARLLVDPDVRAAVDAGARTLPLVAGALGVEPALARRVSALPEIPNLCRGEPGVRVRPMPLGALLAAFGHDRLPLPGDRAEGASLCYCLDELAGILSFAGCSPNQARPADVSRLLLGIPGRGWGPRAARLAAVASEEAGDLVVGLAEWLHALGHRADDVAVAFALLAGHRSLLDLLRASRRWHATPALASWSAHVPEGATWPVPFAPADLGGGWSARALGTLDELRAEGADGPDADGVEGLSHCVATYAVAAMRGDAVLVSIRRDAGEGMARVATGELIPFEDGSWRMGRGRYALRQCKGRRNAEPAREAHAALDVLRTGLADGRFPVDPAALDRRTLPEGPSPRVQAEAVLPLWRPLLPRRLAAGDAEAILAEAGALAATLP